MFKRYAYGMLAISAAALMALAGCAGEPRAAEPAGEQQAGGASATEVASLAARGLEVDYDQLASPAAAATASESIVRGTLVDVTEGISYGGAAAAKAGRAAPYVTFVIEVDAALKGTTAAGGKVYAQVNKSSATDAAQLVKAGKGLAVVAVLDDISGWAPAPGVTVVRPAGVPANGPLYLAFPDGLWLQGSADRSMVGVHAAPAELSAAWGAPQTLDQYWAALEKAAR